MERRVSITDLKAMKKRGEKIVMITAYDYTSARFVEEAGIPLILVGDTLGNVVLGYDTTVPVTMEDIIHHVKPVVRGTKRTCPS
jgi:3-methyl-2-oxobutanoate hydroxymethyltransferase